MKLIHTIGLLALCAQQKHSCDIPPIYYAVSKIDGLSKSRAKCTYGLMKEFVPLF
jgi:hypothetical protein